MTTLRGILKQYALRSKYTFSIEIVLEIGVGCLLLFQHNNFDTIWCSSPLYYDSVQTDHAAQTRVSFSWFQMLKGFSHQRNCNVVEYNTKVSKM